MSEIELLALLRSANESVDSNFRFWLSATFAVLMAFFFAVVITLIYLAMQVHQNTKAIRLAWVEPELDYG